MKKVLSTLVFSMNKLIFTVLAFGTLSAFAQNNNFNRNPIAVVIEGEIYQNQIRIQKTLTDKLSALELANTDQNLKCETPRSYGTSVYSFRSKCRNSSTSQKLVTISVDLKNDNLEFTVRIVRDQTIIIPSDFES